MGKEGRVFFSIDGAVEPTARRERASQGLAHEGLDVVVSLNMGV
jgi:hypothetical protein